MKIKKNIGEIDRKIRIVAGIIMFFSGILINLSYNWILIVVGIILIITSLTRFCGLYILFGINTCKFDRKKI